MAERHHRPLLALLLGLLLAACGGEAPPTARGRPAPPPLPAISDGAKARFALDRFLRGPEPRTQAFRIGKLHALNLDHARRDLIALGNATQQLLSDPELIARVANPTSRDRNPWHGILDVLAALPQADSALVLAWAAPTVDVEGDLPLQRRAVQTLAARNNPDTAPVLLRLLKARPTDRELAVGAQRALVALGSPWRERALATTYASGDVRLWSKVPEGFPAALAERADDGTRTPSAIAAADALAWWTVLAEGSGPAVMHGAGRTETLAWFPGRLILDPSVWPTDTPTLDRAVRANRVLAPATLLEPAGYLPRTAPEASATALASLLTSGSESAFHASCALAEARWAAFAAACPDRTPQAMDPVDARMVLDLFLEDLEGGLEPEPVGVAQALGQLHGAGDPAAVSDARRILVGARPPGLYKRLLEGVGDLLQRDDPVAFAADLDRLARTGDPLDSTVAVTLLRRARMPSTTNTIRFLLEHATDAGHTPLRRLLIWLHTAKDADPEARAAFAAEYGSWVEAAPDAQAASLAPGLLDLGEAGAQTYADGLLGERRPVFVEGLLQRQGLVAPIVAQALFDPVDAGTPAPVRHAVLVAAYRTTPSEAAPHLAALRARLPAAIRVEVDDILASVRHRAGR